MNRIGWDFVRRMMDLVGGARMAEKTTSTTQPFVNDANANPGSVLSAEVTGTYSIAPKPYHMFGDTCWDGPLGVVKLSADNEFSIESNGTYTDDPGAPLVMVQCLLDAYKMALQVPPSMRPK